MFSISPDINLREMSWHNVAKFIFADLANYLNINKQTLLQNCFINFRNQNKADINQLHLMHDPTTSFYLESEKQSVN
ncbi:hypothetical protein J7384_09555 [Endozoicomonas sp. G2_1]|uniref:hypothetical protein n=1 Tax=Endozoicomonas sp. G2_1 TaxID=2821091 RepID=UPI001ADD0876|nr:hypothetical protein [Endozoicomonas sp. G2_1]MBO9490609.1 hypothetical protein [Endozoicomonas sp. G2_1]